MGSAFTSSEGRRSTAASRFVSSAFVAVELITKTSALESGGSGVFAHGGVFVRGRSVGSKLGSRAVGVARAGRVEAGRGQL